MKPRIKIQGQPRHFGGWKRDLPDHRDYTYSFGLGGLFLPASADVSYLTRDIDDQGALGSCTAHASTAAMEFLYGKFQLKIGGLTPNFSRLFVYYSSRVLIEKVAPEDDSGAMLRDVMKALQKFGACLEELWPYEPQRFSIVPPAQVFKAAGDHQVITYYRLPNLRNIKKSIYEGYPVVGGFSVPESIDSSDTQSSGIVHVPGPNERFVGGHAVLFTGYDDQRQLIKFKNSWGLVWGDRGFGYLPYAFFEKNLAADFWTIRSLEF